MGVRGGVCKRLSLGSGYGDAWYDGNKGRRKTYKRPFEEEQPKLSERQMEIDAMR